MAKGRPKDPGTARRGAGHRSATPSPAVPEVVNVPAVVDKKTAAVCSWPAPEELADVAKEAWAVCVNEMQGNRHLRESDLIMLRAYVEAVFVHAEASAKVREFGVLVSGKNGPMPNPMIRVQDNAARTIRLLSENLGLNPIARIRAGIMEIAGTAMVMDIRERLVKEIVKG